MKILMVLEGEFPPDERVEKEIYSLTQAGHEVGIATYTFGSLPLKEEKEYYTIYRKVISKKLHKSSAACLLLPFYFRYWIRYIEEIRKEFTFDTIHIHDLPLSKVGYFFKKKYAAKLVCDQHEFYSDWIVKTAHYNRGLGKIVNLFSNWAKYERRYLSRADFVITVEEPLKKLYQTKVGLSAKPIVVTPNTPLLKTYSSANSVKAIAEKHQGKLKLFYAGGIDMLRGLELVFEALAALDNKKDIVFIIAGKERKGYSIAKLVEKYSAQQYIDFVGWVDSKELPSYMASCDLGVFTPILNRDEIHHTIATKIYQYAAVGLPVVITKAKMMANFVEKHKIGFVIDKATELSALIEAVQTKPQLLTELKPNCHQAAKGQFWEDTSKAMVKQYAEL